MQAKREQCTHNQCKLNISTVCRLMSSIAKALRNDYLNVFFNFVLVFPLCEEVNCVRVCVRVCVCVSVFIFFLFILFALCLCVCLFRECCLRIYFGWIEIIWWHEKLTKTNHPLHLIAIVYLQIPNCWKTAKPAKYTKLALYSHKYVVFLAIFFLCSPGNSITYLNQ